MLRVPAAPNGRCYYNTCSRKFSRGGKRAPRPLGYEPSDLPLIYPAIVSPRKSGKWWEQKVARFPLDFFRIPLIYLSYVPAWTEGIAPS